MENLQPALSIGYGQQRRVCAYCGVRMRFASLRPHPLLNRLDVCVFECLDCKRTRKFLSLAYYELN